MCSENYFEKHDIFCYPTYNVKVFMCFLIIIFVFSKNFNLKDIILLNYTFMKILIFIFLIF